MGTTLVASATDTASGTSTITLATGVVPKAATFQLAVTAASGTTPTLDAYVQHSVDGTNWEDFVAFTQMTAAGRRYARWSAYADPGTTNDELVESDAGLSAGVVQGPTSGQWRLKYTIGGTTPSFTFSLKAALI